MESTRRYRFKEKFSQRFYCPLCRAERVLTVRRNLDWKHVLQMTLIFGVSFLGLYPWISWRGIGLPIVIYPLFFAIRKTLFRMEIPCPHCGLDAIWYKKDVKRARKLVENFWKQKSPTP